MSKRCPHGSQIDTAEPFRPPVPQVPARCTNVFLSKPTGADMETFVAANALSVVAARQPVMPLLLKGRAVKAPLPRRGACSSTTFNLFKIIFLDYALVCVASTSNLTSLREPCSTPNRNTEEPGVYRVRLGQCAGFRFTKRCDSSCLLSWEGTGDP